MMEMMDTKNDREDGVPGVTLKDILITASIIFALLAVLLLVMFGKPMYMTYIAKERVFDWIAAEELHDEYWSTANRIRISEQMEQLAESNNCVTGIVVSVWDDKAELRMPTNVDVPVTVYAYIPKDVLVNLDGGDLLTVRGEIESLSSTLYRIGNWKSKARVIRHIAAKDLVTQVEHNPYPAL